MADPQRVKRKYPLASQIGWFISLRWLAGAVTVAGGAIDWLWIKRYPAAPRMIAVGVAILLYNAFFWQFLRHWADRRGVSYSRRSSLVLAAWAQIAMDLACLTLLTIGSGGLMSPLLGFFVFHMVFASLILQRTVAFGGPALAVAMMGSGLWFTKQLPSTLEQKLMIVGWGVTLLLTVYVANVITRDLRRHRRRLLRKNRRIRTIKDQLERHQEMMIQQEKMAGLGQMAAGVAHEIANPLASMDSVLQLMLRNPQKVTTQNIETLRQQVARIHRTVQQMTAFAHPLESQWRTMPLNEVVEGAQRLVTMDGRWRRARIEADLDPATGSIALLPQAVEQVLVNLIFNALDAMQGTEQPVLRLRTWRSERWCCIEVSDNGEGIRPEHLNRVFEPFFTTKPVGKGTGLGLSISYSLIRKQGGDIKVHSVPGAGATFTIRLPVATAMDKPQIED